MHGIRSTVSGQFRPERRGSHPHILQSFARSQIRSARPVPLHSVHSLLAGTIQASVKPKRTTGWRHWKVESRAVSLIAPLCPGLCGPPSSIPVVFSRAISLQLQRICVGTTRDMPPARGSLRPSFSEASKPCAMSPSVTPADSPFLFRSASSQWLLARQKPCVLQRNQKKPHQQCSCSCWLRTAVSLSLGVLLGSLRLWERFPLFWTFGDGLGC